MREVENLPFGPTARWTSLSLVGSSTYGKKTDEGLSACITSKTFIFADPPRWREMNDPKFKIHHSRSPRHFFTNSAPGKQQQEASVRHTRKSKDTPR